MTGRRGLLLAGGALTASAVAGLALWKREAKPQTTILSYEELTGSLFLRLPPDPIRAPGVREIVVPPTPDATAIWGATGRDARGHLWFGVSATRNGMSAHLLEYDVSAERWRDHGAVTTQLRAAGMWREGEGQIKIHSRIVPGGDGWLYFASTDEESEDEHGTPPRWGGHLWRIHPDTGEWQHLHAAREGLIAVAGVGRYIYALGYWGHVLFQFDAVTQSVRRAAVGSVGAHVSRNFLADFRGHAFVPRLRAMSDGKVESELVEFTPALTEVGATRLDFYLGAESPALNHGITGIAYLPDGNMLFSTHHGQLYRVEPRKDAPALVVSLGWLHPAGEAYAPSLFAWGGNDWVAGVTRRGEFEWVLRDLRTGAAVAHPIDTDGLQKVVLYGSMARDNLGRAYVAGWAAKENGGGQRPLLLQIDPGQ